jgi:type IV secretion system protein VirB5
VAVEQTDANAPIRRIPLPRRGGEQTDAGSGDAAAVPRNIADARRVAGDRIENAKRDARSWRTAFWVNFAVHVGTIGVLAYTALSPRFVPYVVAVDRLNVAVPVGPADRADLRDPAVVGGELTRFINDVRTVSTDPHAQQGMVERAYAYAGPSVVRVLNAYFRRPENDTRLVSKRAVRMVEVLSVLPGTNGESWKVRWDETEIEHGTGARTTTAWEAEMRVQHGGRAEAQRRTVKAINLNPRNLYVVALTWAPISNPDPSRGGL